MAFLYLYKLIITICLCNIHDFLQPYIYNDLSRKFVSILKMGRIGTIGTQKNPTKKIIDVDSLLLVKQLFNYKKRSNFNLIGEIFIPNYFDTPYLYTNFFAFKFYTTQLFQYLQSKKYQQNHKLF